jgi:3-hydroxyisobutyrate dehydrogenase-like beta-hydroxyacid dehydrogenase
MKIGFLGFGEVASTISKGLLTKGCKIYTSVEGRSQKTKSLAKEVAVELYTSNREVAEISDILISAVTPSKAVDVAREVGRHCSGVYVDINNISPHTVKEVAGYIENGKMVDASIIGSVLRKKLKVHIIASGSYAESFAKLNEYDMNISIVGREIGHASAIKILRSAFTKGVSALLFESLYSAHRMGIDDMVLECIVETECEDFRESSISRIISSGVHAERRSEEMEEVVDLISEHTNPLLARATYSFFRSLYPSLKDIEKSPKDYREIFSCLDKY